MSKPYNPLLWRRGGALRWIAFAALLAALSAPAAQAQELLHTLEAPNAEVFGFFGISVSGVADADGDGRSDLLVGALHEDVDGVEAAGRAYLFSGATGALLHTLASSNAEFAGRFGNSVSGVADADGDGRGDLLIGAPYETGDGLFEGGRAYLFSGAAGAPPEDVTPPECQLVGLEPGPPTRLRIRLRDGGSGLRQVRITQSQNATVAVGPFDEGFRRVVFVLAEKLEEEKRATVVLEVEDVAGNVTTCDPVVTTVSAEVPEAFALSQNYPNPFNPATAIRFELPEASLVRLAVYDVVGREVALLVSDRMEAGTYEVEWEGTDAAGRALPSGVYLYRIEVGRFTDTKTMTLLK